MRKDIQVIAETDELLVLNKPAGLIVHSDGRTEESSVADWILENYPALKDVGESWTSPQGEIIPLRGIAHRLDRGTSGVLLVAKTDEMYAYLKNEFKERRVEKVYRAYVYGRMEAESGRIVAEIAKGTPVARFATTLGFSKVDESAKKISAPKKWYAKPCDESDVRAAITDWKLIENLPDQNAAYLELRPRTGRTHQIRVHLASIGHAVVGDPLYSTDKAPSKPAERMLLHASQLTLTLPNTPPQSFTAPLPSHFVIF